MPRDYATTYGAYEPVRPALDQPHYEPMYVPGYDSGYIQHPVYDPRYMHNPNVRYVEVPANPEYRPQERVRYVQVPTPMPVAVS